MKKLILTMVLYLGFAGVADATNKHWKNKQSFSASTGAILSASGGSLSQWSGKSSNSTNLWAGGNARVHTGCGCALDIQTSGRFDFKGMSNSQSWGNASAGSDYTFDGGFNAVGEISKWKKW